MHAVFAFALFHLRTPLEEAPSKPVFAKRYLIIPLRPDLLRPPQGDFPPIAPSLPIGDGKYFRAPLPDLRTEAIVRPPDAASGRQVVWQPDKPKPLPAETPLPNLIAVQAPSVPFPSPPSPLPPESPGKQESKTVSTPGSPSPASSTAPKPKPKLFTPPKSQPALPLDSGSVPAPPPDIPAVTDSVPVSIAGIGALPKRPAPFAPPPNRPFAAGNTGLAGLSAPPEVNDGGTNSPVTVAVIGLDPASVIASLPDGSRSAEFSRGNSAGEPSSEPRRQGPVIPNVAVAGRAGPSGAIAPPPLSSTPKTFSLTVPPGAATLSAPLRPASRRIPGIIESRFPGRIVYVLIVPKPNLPDYSADWIIWFSDPAPLGSQSAAMRAPVPIRKALHAAWPSGRGTGGASRIHFAAVVSREGRIASIVCLSEAGTAGATKAAEDLSRWEFRPATRNGEAISVDVVIELPYLTW